MKAVVSLSGGMDSTALLYRVHRETDGEVATISFDYGQRHLKELEAAVMIASDLGVPHTIVKIGASNPIFLGSSQTDRSVEVPEGHYEDPTMRLTFVPNRNMIFLALASAYAISMGAKHVYFAAHAGDHAIYPDCREPFVDALNRTLREASYEDKRVHVRAPYVFMTKAEIAAEGFKNHVPFAKTWSCYAGGTIHCGRCGTCNERKESFRLAGIVDPTDYES